MQVVIRGAVTTSSFTHQTSPEGKGSQMKTNALVQGRMVSNIPYISANSVRGMIRRAASDEVFDQLAKAKEKISRNLYLSIVRGSFARTGLQSGGATYQQMLAASEHAFAGLFGGGAFMYRSTMRIERDLVPILTETSGLFPAEVRHFAVDLPPAKLLERRLMAPRDDFAKLPRQAREIVEDVDKAYTEHMSTKVTQSAAKKSGEAESKDDLDNFAITEGIVAGVPLYFGITTESISEAQAGLLLRGLLTWCNRNALGGGTVRGRGGFVPNLSLAIDGQQITNNLFVGDAPHLKLSENERVSSLLDALAGVIEEEAAATVLAGVYPSEVEEKEDKTGKKGRKAKVEDSKVESDEREKEE